MHMKPVTGLGTMRRHSKFKAFLFDIAVLAAVVGGLGLACKLGPVDTTISARAVPTHMVQAGPSLQSTVDF
jgi:hypothetical protein